MALSGCAKENYEGQGKTSPPMEESGKTVGEGGVALRVLVPPYAPASKVLMHFRPMIERLESETDQTVEAFVAHSYSHQIRRIRQGRFDLAYLGPAQYVRIHPGKEQDPGGPTELLAMGEPVCGCLVVRQDSPLGNPAGLSGHTLAFGAVNSLGGYFVPRILLDRHGVTLWDLADYQHLGRHERVARAVLAGDFEAGGLNCPTAERFLQREPGLRILGRINAIDPPVWVARADMARPVRQTIQTVLTRDEKEEDFAPLPSPLNFRAPDNPNFDRTRRMMRSIEGAL